MKLSMRWNYALTVLVLVAISRFAFAAGPVPGTVNMPEQGATSPGAPGAAAPATPPATSAPPSQVTVLSSGSNSSDKTAKPAAGTEADGQPKVDSSAISPEQAPLQNLQTVPMPSDANSPTANGTSGAATAPPPSAVAPPATSTATPPATSTSGAPSSTTGATSGAATAAPAVPPSGTPNMNGATAVPNAAPPGALNAPAAPTATGAPPANGLQKLDQSPNQADKKGEKPSEELSAPVEPTYAQPSTNATFTNVQSHEKIYAIVKTTMGSFSIHLFTDQSPKTSKNFIELSSGAREFIDSHTGRKVRRPFYNGLLFHKVIRGFVIQTGCPFGNGKGGPGYTIPDEPSMYLRHNKAGIVSMANAGKDTAGSQFFITLAPHPELDGKYTIFGEIVSGMDVVNKISRVAIGPTNRPIKRIIVETVEISKKP